MEKVIERLVTTVGAFRGNYPDIPLPSDIVIEELTGGADPFFVTLPVLKIGAKSRNTSLTRSGKRVNRIYGEAAARAIAEKINQDRPGGVLGHPEPGQRSAAPNAVQWLAAQIADGYVFGKGYVLSHRADVREDIRVRAAANARIATSLIGSIEGVEETGEVIDLTPTNVDLVDPDEAGIEDLAARPHLTRESQEKGENEESMETIQELLKLRDQDRSEITELKGELEETKKRIAELEGVVGDIAEIRSLLGEVKGKEVVAEVKALVNEVATLRRKTLVAEIEAAMEGFEQLKLEGARALALEHLGVTRDDEGLQIVAEVFPANLKAARERIDNWLKRPTVQQILKSLAVAEMGPGAYVPGRNNGGHSQELKDTPETRAAARQKFGI